jgi:release factor glutamine methyltransferase
MHYTPSDDTFLLADCIKQYYGQWALEIGVGSGLLLQILERNFQNVVGSDISLQALEYTKSRSTAMLVCCDAASAFAGGMFDLIVSNPPYLPDDDDEKVKDSTVHGGPAGIETTIHFVRSALPQLAHRGKMLIVVSTLANSAELERLLAEETKMRKKVIKEKKLFYETLSAIELSR